jgi:multicomponent Na+:H+ antiporter subunit A
MLARLFFKPALLISVFVTFKGHNAPGGGFAGGLIVGAAFVLRYLAGGLQAVGLPPRVSPYPLVGAGLAVSLLTGIGALVAGGEFLESDIWKVTAPLIGEVKVVTSAFLDVGVYLVVVGVVLGVLFQLGSDVAPSPEALAYTERGDAP